MNKCLGCMSEFRGYPCPDCGFSPENQRGLEYTLPMETILAGKYLVGRVLGQGGFGITYIGWDLALERKVAIKEYYPSGQVSRAPGTRTLTWYTSDSARQARENGMQMFLKEARKMVRADGIAGVVRVLDLFQDNETAYIVMEFVEGRTLKSLLQKNGPMPWEQAKEIFLPAIRAMEKVHGAGLVHRDLSPDNLMIAADGTVKILDLGAAKDLNINSGASSMQVAKGGFSPLEQYTQRGGSGPWTDVYAMAATLYYTLTGVLPPTSIDRLEEDTIRWDYPGLLALPTPAQEALKQAMAIQAKKRTQTMAELEKGLLAREPESDPPKPPEPEPPKPPETPRPELPEPEPPKPKLPKPEPAKPGREKKKLKKLRIVLPVLSGLLLCLLIFGVLYCWGRYTYEENGTGITITGYENIFGEHVPGFLSKKLTIPEKIRGKYVTSIGTSAFTNCSSLTTVFIPDSVTSIERQAFYRCISLTSVAIPDSVTSIGADAFTNCTSLTSVSIPDSVTSIGADAFYNCSSLTTVSIPDSVTEIGSLAFYNTPWLRNQTDTFVICGDGVLLRYNGNSTHVEIPATVKKIVDAFSDCTSLEGVTIPDSVTSIGGSAFENCSSLTTVFIPDSVTTIGEGAFSDCISLTGVTIPEGVTSIGWGAFQHCTSLTGVTIPEGVTTIEGKVFSGCTSLTGVTIPEGVTTIEWWAFFGCTSLTGVTIPEGVTSIGWGAFQDCTSLTGVTIPDSVTSIRQEVFAGCTSLTRVSIPQNCSASSSAFPDGCAVTRY